MRSDNKKDKTTNFPKNVSKTKPVAKTKPTAKAKLTAKDKVNSKPAPRKAVKNAAKPSKCPVSKKCGGCQMIDVPYKEQLKRKHKRVEELIGKYGTVEPFIEMDKPEHYRCKVHAVFTHDRKGNPVSGNCPVKHENR